MGERPYTVMSLADRWGCSEGLIRNMIRRGELTCVRFGTLIRIPAVEVERAECPKNIASNDSAAPTQSSIRETESASVNGYTRPTGLERKLRRGEAGAAATVHRGPWDGS